MAFVIIERLRTKPCESVDIKVYSINFDFLTSEDLSLFVVINFVLFACAGLSLLISSMQSCKRMDSEDCMDLSRSDGE